MGIKSRRTRTSKYKTKPNKPLHKNPAPAEPEPPKLVDFKLANRDNLPLRVQQERHDRPAVLPYDENRYYRNLIESRLDKDNYVKVDNAIGFIEIVTSNYQQHYLVAPNLTSDRQAVKTDIIRYLADHNCFFIYGRQLQMVEQPVIGGSELSSIMDTTVGKRRTSSLEKKQKRELISKYPMKPISETPVTITFYLAKGTEVWQLKQPEMYRLGKDYYVLYGNVSAEPIPVEQYMNKRMQLSNEQIPYPQQITRTTSSAATRSRTQAAEQPDYHHQSTSDQLAEQQAHKRHAKEIINNQSSTKNDRQQSMQTRFVGGERNKK